MLPVVTLLIEAGVNVTTTNDDDLTAAQIAAECGHERLEAFLVEHGSPTPRDVFCLGRLFGELE